MIDILIAYEINFDTTKFSKLFHAYTQLRLTYEVEDFFWFGFSFRFGDILSPLPGVANLRKTVDTLQKSSTFGNTVLWEGQGYFSSM